MTGFPGPTVPFYSGLALDCNTASIPFEASGRWYCNGHVSEATAQGDAAFSGNYGLTSSALLLGYCG